MFGTGGRLTHFRSGAGFDAFVRVLGEGRSTTGCFRTRMWLFMYILGARGGLETRVTGARPGGSPTRELRRAPRDGGSLFL